MTTASSPSPAISRVQASMFALAKAVPSCPRWWVSAPQHPLPEATTTSQPCRFRRRIVASLICGASTCCAQPVSSATRFTRAPSAGKTWGREESEALGSASGTIRSMVRSRSGRNGISRLPSQPLISAARNSFGRGSTSPSMRRVSRSCSGRR